MQGLQPSFLPAMSDFIYLASQSPRRRQLLEQIGVRHELLLPNTAGDQAEDAEAIELELPGEAPRDYVQRVTGLKLDAAVGRPAPPRRPPPPPRAGRPGAGRGGRGAGPPPAPPGGV